MSCIRFSTAPQRAAMHGADGHGESIVHRAPPVTPSKIARLRLLAADPSPGIRGAAASSRHAPADLLERLAQDGDPAVRGEVARNESAPPALLAALAHDPEPRVRCWSALNVHLPASALIGLADDADEGVRRLAAFRLTPV